MTFFLHVKYNLQGLNQNMESFYIFASSHDTAVFSHSSDATGTCELDILPSDLHFSRQLLTTV